MLNGCNREIRVLFCVLFQEITVVHLINVISGQDQSILGFIQKFGIPENCIRRSAITLSSYRRKAHERRTARCTVPKIKPARSDVAVKLLMVVLRENRYPS